MFLLVVLLVTVFGGRVPLLRKFCARQWGIHCHGHVPIEKEEAQSENDSRIVAELKEHMRLEQRQKQQRKVHGRQYEPYLKLFTHIFTEFDCIDASESEDTETGLDDDADESSRGTSLPNVSERGGIMAVTEARCIICLENLTTDRETMRNTLVGAPPRLSQRLHALLAHTRQEAPSRLPRAVRSTRTTLQSNEAA